MGVGQPPGGVCCDTSLFRIRLVRQVRASRQWPGGVFPGGTGGDADGIVRAGARACFACRSMVWRPAFCVPCHTDICRAGCSSAVHQPLQRAAMAITACCAVTCSALRFSGCHRACHGVALFVHGAAAVSAPAREDGRTSAPPVGCLFCLLAPYGNLSLGNALLSCFLLCEQI